MTRNIGWRVTVFAILINLASGFIYAWSVWAAALIEELNFTRTEAILPYTVALAVLALMLVPGGKLFDKFGPRMVAVAGGIFITLGMIMASLQVTILGLVFWFGLIVGTGAGISYGVSIPSAVSWFPPAQRGLVSGLVVAGLGLAAAYAAPLAQLIINSVGVQKTFMIYGVVFGILVCLFGLGLRLPSPNHIPAGTPDLSAGREILDTGEFSPLEMMCTPSFWLIWFMYCFGAVAGLMVIGHIAIISGIQAGLKWGFVLVAILAVFNSGGRIIGGFISDKIGRKITLTMMFILQAVNMLLFTNYTTAVSLTIGVCITGIAYGSLLAIFPVITYDYYGMENRGINYGLVFTAFGAAGIIGPLTAGKIADVMGTYDLAYIAAAVILGLAAIMALFLKPPVKV